jgi:hypothetical protein
MPISEKVTFLAGNAVTVACGTRFCDVIGGIDDETASSVRCRKSTAKQLDLNDSTTQVAQWDECDTQVAQWDECEEYRCE